MPRSEESEPALIVPEGLIFIMLGLFLATGGGTWFSYQSHQADSIRSVYYVCVGLIVMGVALMAIGLGIGRMALRTRSKANKVEIVDKDQPIGHES